MTEERQLVELNPSVARLREECLLLELEYESSLPETEENKEDLEKLQRRLNVVRQALQRLREQKFQEAIELKYEQVRTAAFNSQHATLLAEERLEEIRGKQEDVERKLQQYRRLQDELEFLTTTREKTLEYLREVRRIVAERSAIQVELAEAPVTPEERSQPQWYFATFGPGILVVYAVLLGLYRLTLGRRAGR